MCTILFAREQFAEAPIAIAANRDESPDRPATSPRVVDGDPRILMPVDERAGGTWMGINEHRLFAIVANRWTVAELAGDRSRGLLVRDVLETDSVAAAASVVRSETARNEYDGFSLLVATPDDAAVFTWDGVLREQRVEPGIHVLVNVGMDGTYDVPEKRRSIGKRQTEAADRLRENLETGPDETVDEWLDRAGRALGDHDYGACIHHERYGTVSSSLVSVGDDGGIEWQYADGPPCETAFGRVDGQI